MITASTTGAREAQAVAEALAALPDALDYRVFRLGAEVSARVGGVSRTGAVPQGDESSYTGYSG